MLLHMLALLCLRQPLTLTLPGRFHYLSHFTMLRAEPVKSRPKAAILEVVESFLGPVSCPLHPGLTRQGDGDGRGHSRALGEEKPLSRGSRDGRPVTAAVKEKVDFSPGASVDFVQLVVLLHMRWMGLRWPGSWRK